MNANDPTDPNPHAPPPLPAQASTPLRAAAPLAYGRDHVPQPRTPFVVRILMGFVGYVVLSVALFWSGFAIGFPEQLVWFGWLAMTAALVGVAIYVRIKYRFSGLGYGILGALLLAVLIVVGLIALIIGLCVIEYNKRGI